MRIIWTAYSKEADITFIMEDKRNKTEVIGFYYGEPSQEATEKFQGRLVASFEDEGA